MNRTLHLRKETLAELTPADLAEVCGAGISFDNCITWICTPLITVVVTATTQIPGKLSVADCA